MRSVPTPLYSFLSHPRCPEEIRKKRKDEMSEGNTGPMNTQYPSRQCKCTNQLLFPFFPSLFRSLQNQAKLKFDQPIASITNKTTIRTKEEEKKIERIGKKCSVRKPIANQFPSLCKSKFRQHSNSTETVDTQEHTLTASCLMSLGSPSTLTLADPAALKILETRETALTGALCLNLETAPAAEGAPLPICWRRLGLTCLEALLGAEEREPRVALLDLLPIISSSDLSKLEDMFFLLSSVCFCNQYLLMRNRTGSFLFLLPGILYYIILYYFFPLVVFLFKKSTY